MECRAPIYGESAEQLQTVPRSGGVNPLRPRCQHRRVNTDGGYARASSVGHPFMTEIASNLVIVATSSPAAAARSSAGLPPGETTASETLESSGAGELQIKGQADVLPGALTHSEEARDCEPVRTSRYDPLRKFGSSAGVEVLHRWQAVAGWAGIKTRNHSSLSAIGDPHRSRLASLPEFA